MATKKEIKKGMVKINQSSIDKVKKKIIGTKQTIGGFYEEAAIKELAVKKTITKECGTRVVKYNA